MQMFGIKLNMSLKQVQVLNQHENTKGNCFETCETRIWHYNKCFVVYASTSHFVEITPTPPKGRIPQTQKIFQGNDELLSHNNETYHKQHFDRQSTANNRFWLQTA